ncbi:MAG: hypothetical protein WCH83_03010 [Alphaproteobacteria bacterium]
MTRSLNRRSILRVTLLAAASVPLMACESLQDIPSLFERKPAPLPGDRRDVFPGGVPGIDRTIQQPANAPPDANPVQGQPPGGGPSPDQPRR